MEDRVEISFSLYSGDIARLLMYLVGAKIASFDVTEKGYVIVHVAGKEPITL